jgi:hypothetical protein
VLEQGELPGPHAAGADVVHFAGTDEVVQGEHGFFEGGVRVEAVDLEEVEVVELEAGEGGVDGFEDGGAGEACVGYGVSAIELRVGWLIESRDSPPRFT